MFKCYRPLSTRNAVRPRTARILFAKENSEPIEANPTEHEELRSRANEPRKPALPLYPKRKAWKPKLAEEE